MNFLAELKRRNVLRVGAAYVVTAWLVIQVVETIFPAFGFGDAALRNVTIALAVGLFPVLVLSWVFEWTPDGLKRDSDVEAGAPSSAAAAKRLDRIILIVLALALGYFAFDKFVLDPARDAEIAEAARQEGRSEAIVESYGDASIAVLAFADMSPGKDQEYLSDGISEEVLHLLEKIDGLRVISRTSAFSFKGKDIPVTEIGRELNVAHVLEGSVRKAGDRVRITAQLIDARTDMHLWSESWDRTLDDIFAIQDELAAAMVEQLQIELLGELPTQQRVDPDAYLLLLQARHAMTSFDFDQAMALFKQVVAQAPEYADGWAALARLHFWAWTIKGQPDRETDENWKRALEALDRVIEIEPGHVVVLSRQAWLAVEYERDYARAAHLLETALARNPGYWDIVRDAAHLANLIRKDDVALRLLEGHLERDPLCGDCNLQYARLALQAARFDRVEEAVRRVQQVIGPKAGRLTLAVARLLNGDTEGAGEVLADLHNDAGQSGHEGTALNARYLDLVIRLYLDRSAVDPSEIDRFVGQSPKTLPIDFVTLLEIYALAAMPDAAFELLAEIRAKFYPAVVGSITLSPLLRNLHEDPRWLEILEYAGVAPHQVAAIEFEPELPGHGLSESRQ